MPQPRKSRRSTLLASTFAVLGVTLTTLLSSCSGSSEPEQRVVVYCALDLVFAEPVLRQFTKETGIRVDIKGDTEAAKTTGLAQLIHAEKAKPSCDVFWNNEIIQTLHLQQQGCLEPYAAPHGATLPKNWKDPEHYWHAIAARARVLVYNPEMITEDQLPGLVSDLTKPEWKGAGVIARPLFGTTATHVSTLYTLWGPEKGRAFLSDLKANEIGITDGNAAVVRLVASGEYAFGLTDTDDVFMGLKDAKNIKWAMIGQDPSHPDTLLIPNTIAMIKDAPHPEAAQTLINYLLSPEVETLLRESDSHQIPLQPGLKPPMELTGLKAEAIEFQSVEQHLKTVFADLKALGF